MQGHILQLRGQQGGGGARITDTFHSDGERCSDLDTSCCRTSEGEAAERLFDVSSLSCWTPLGFLLSQGSPELMASGPRQLFVLWVRRPDREV